MVKTNKWSIAEKKFMESTSSLQEVSDFIHIKSKGDKKQSVYMNFVKNAKINKKNLIPALEEEILKVITKHNPDRASKLIMELIWMTRKEWKGS